MSRIAEAGRSFVASWPERAAELLGRRGWAVWEVGYGPGGPDALGYLAEALVRVAELWGAGLVVAVADELLWGRRYRPLTAREAAFAKTYVAPDVLAKAAIDEGSRVARVLQIAYVLGTVVKSGGRPSGSLLVHELVHVGQFRRWGWAYVAKALWSQHRGAGYAYAVGTLPQNLNAEQAAAYTEDRARRALGLRPRWKSPGAV